MIKMKNASIDSKTEHPFLDLKMIIQILIAKKNTIILISVILSILSLVYVSFSPTYYESRIILKFQNTQLNSIINNEINALDPSNMRDPVSVQLALLRSDFILKSVIDALKLNITLTPKKSFFKKNKGEIDIQHFDVSSNLLNNKLELVIKDNDHYQLYNAKGKFLLAGKTGQTVTDKANRLSIKIDTINAFPGSRFTLIKKADYPILNEIRSHLKITDLNNSSDNNENSIALLQLTLRGKNPQFILDMLNKTAFVAADKNINLKYMKVNKTLSFLKQELPILKNSLESAEQKLNAYRTLNGRVNVELQTGYLINHLSSLDKELEGIRVKKTNLLQQYTSHHPMIVSLNEEQNEIEKQRYTLIKQLRQLPASNQEDVNLMRDVKIKNDLYLKLLNEIHQLEVYKAGIISDVQILSPATLPETIPHTRKSFIAIVSLIIGLFIGALWVIFSTIVTRYIFHFYPLLGRSKYSLE